MHVPGPAGRTIAALAALAIAFGCEPKDPTVRETPVKIVKEVTGVGRPAMKGDVVTISYRVHLEDGRVILRPRYEQETEEPLSEPGEG